MKSAVQRLDPKKLAAMAPADRKRMVDWVTSLDKAVELKPLGDFEVAANSVALAHASANRIADRRVMKSAAFKMIKLFNAKGFTKLADVRNVLKGIEQYILSEKIDRPSGSRNKAAWIVFFTSADTSEDSLLSLVFIFLERGKVFSKEVGLHLSPHSLARIMQRGTSSSDLSKILHMIKPHLLTAAHLLFNDELDGLESYHIGNCDGKLIFTRLLEGGDDYGWRAATWLSPQMYTQEETESTDTSSPSTTWLSTYKAGREQ